MTINTRSVSSQVRLRRRGPTRISAIGCLLEMTGFARCAHLDTVQSQRQRGQVGPSGVNRCPGPGPAPAPDGLARRRGRVGTWTRALKVATHASRIRRRSDGETQTVEDQTLSSSAYESSSEPKRDA